MHIYEVEAVGHDYRRYVGRFDTLFAAKEACIAIYKKYNGVSSCKEAFKKDDGELILVFDKRFYSRLVISPIKINDFNIKDFEL